MSATGALRILVVDDSPTTRQMLQAAVEALAEERGTAAHVDTAASGLKALQLLPGQRYDLILTDINMPDVHGLELIRFVRKQPQHKDTPILVISTEGAEKDRQKAMALGASAYLVKPVEMAAFRKTVDGLWPTERAR